MRHGILSNTYAPMVRPLNGIFEQLKSAGKVCAMYYGWEPIRDISRPGSLTFASYMHSYSDEKTDALLTDSAISCMEKYEPDFVFLYMAETDDKGGHDNGWMSKKYLECISLAIDNVKRVYERFGDKYTIIVTADHGGHDRTHGTELPEDMTIPMFFIGKRFECGKEIEKVSLLDIAPTVTDIMGVSPAPEWEGRSVAK